MRAGSGSDAHRSTYARRALDQLPRLLGNTDRDPYSPTYGCMHRDYWLDKTSDFPDAVRQFGAHALALVYARDFPDNPYRGSDRVREWAVAALDFWAGIQHGDGSFDEFYPAERGWVGPTAFTTFTSVEALRLLGDEVPAPVAERVRAAIGRAARFIGEGESEEDHLANHHAMACLAVWKAYRLLDEPDLREGYDRVWNGFLDYHDRTEGWSREYDGVDPGYLSATVSFLGKVYQENPDPAILEVLEQSVEFCSYFVYPNGFYAGSMGSRNTLHFYPHGFELLAGRIPLAGAVAERLLGSLEEGKLVPPAIISDRYVVYRVPEFLQSYLDYGERADPLPPLPYERESLRAYFPGGRIFAAVDGDRYVVSNLAKGGVVKVFDRREGRLLLNDCGWIGRLDGGAVITTQWIDPDHAPSETESGWEVSGAFNRVPGHKLFTPARNILFRLTLILLGWSPRFSHWLKGTIRKVLMLGTRPVGLRFRRTLRIEPDAIVLSDELRRDGGPAVEELAVGGEFFVRYVPQSRYFQSQELEVRSEPLSAEQLEELNRTGCLRVERRIVRSASATPA